VLLISGWLIVIAALVLLSTLMSRISFVGAGIAVELIGLGLLAQAYRIQQGAQGQQGGRA